MGVMFGELWNLGADVLHLARHYLQPNWDCGEMAEEESAEEEGISDLQLQRQMLYDAFSEPEAAAALIGLNPISGDVADMELAAHKARVAALAPILPLLFSQANFMGAATAVLQTHQQGADGDELVAVQMVFTNIIKASVIASVSTAVGLGVLSVNKEVCFHDE